VETIDRHRQSLPSSIVIDRLVTRLEFGRCVDFGEAGLAKCEVSYDLGLIDRIIIADT